MSKRKRLEYLIITSCVLLSGFVIYGFVGSIQPLINDSKVASFFVFGALAGFGFSLILSAIILSSRFFQKRGLTFKIVAAVLWPITFACCFYVGVFMYIPYGIYNGIGKGDQMILEKLKESNVNKEYINSLFEFG